MSAAPIPPLSYHAMRMRWCRVALLGFLRRWGVYLLVLAAVIGGGVSDGAGEIIIAAASWLVLPLMRAAAGPWWLPAVLLQALAGALLLWGMRPLLWPQRWAEAERALPLQRRDTLRSDAVVVLLGLLPLLLLCAVGATNVLAHHPAWLRGARGRALAALLVAATGSAVLGIAGLQALRRAGSGRQPRRTAAFAARATRNATAHWLRVLLWWPLWRGPARRTGHALLLGSAALCLPACGIAWRPDATGWWLAAFASLALLATTRANGLARSELAGLWEACAPLPVQPGQLDHARATMAWLPLLPGSAGLLAALPWAEVRPAVLAAYWLVCAGGCAVEVLAPPADAGAKSSRWLFGLVLTIALGTEVLK